MPKVTFLPMNETYEAKDGQSVLDVAIENDVPLQHACGGFCACTTCHIHVKSGLNSLSPIEEDEEERLDRATSITLQSRLGCRAYVHGDVVVEIQNIGHGH
ncbi:MAG: 2Fe-2S iron-sulfur cluster-binding protein [Oligoflexia bacterium]|nr:2Fe-2S iron-sulfur cluster-binding protein [Oligoflexia bacterium]